MWINWFGFFQCWIYWAFKKPYQLFYRVFQKVEELPIYSVRVAYRKTKQCTCKAKTDVSWTSCRNLRSIADWVQVCIERIIYSDPVGLTLKVQDWLNTGKTIHQNKLIRLKVRWFHQLTQEEKSTSSNSCVMELLQIRNKHGLPPFNECAHRLTSANV